ALIGFYSGKKAPTRPVVAARAASPEEAAPRAVRQKPKPPPPPSPQDTQWFILKGGKTLGPISNVELQRYVEQGFIEGPDYLWNESYADWRRADTVLKLPTRNS